MEVIVKTKTGVDMGFAYNTRTEWYLGETKRAAGYGYNEEVQFENGVVMKHYAALKSYGFVKNKLPEGYTIDEFIDLLDNIPEAEQLKLMEAAEEGLGFTHRQSMEASKAMAMAMIQSGLQHGTIGTTTGKKEKGSPLGGLK